MKYDLKAPFVPGNYTLGEGLHLKARDNELTEAQAAPYLDAGILQEQTRPKRKAKGKKKRGKR